MKRKIFSCTLLLFVLSLSSQTPEQWKTLERPLNFFLANDLGRNGYYLQKPIAELMGHMAETVDIACVVAAGDVHHFHGVRSTSDPLWTTNYELIYSHPELMLPWYAILGNHEYRGNTNAVLDYANISARWNMPNRYYTKVLEEDDITLRLVLIDTSPLIEKYRRDTQDYPDAVLQDDLRQLQWLDSVLTASREDWVIVVGHHPIYADTGKDTSERDDMQRRVDTILRRHPCVDMYLCGHIHNFQHIRHQDSTIDYVVNSSASLSRGVNPVEGTVFCSPLAGFSLIAADSLQLNLHMIDPDGNVIHTVTRTK